MALLVARSRIEQAFPEGNATVAHPADAAGDVLVTVMAAVWYAFATAAGAAMLAFLTLHAATSTGTLFWLYRSRSRALGWRDVALAHLAGLGLDVVVAGAVGALLVLGLIVGGAGTP